MLSVGTIDGSDSVWRTVHVVGTGSAVHVNTDEARRNVPVGVVHHSWDRRAALVDRNNATVLACDSRVFENLIFEDQVALKDFCFGHLLPRRFVRWVLRPSSLDDIAAVDDKDGPGYIASLARREERHGCGNLLGPARPSDRCAISSNELCLARASGGNPTWSHCIDCDPWPTSSSARLFVNRPVRPGKRPRRKERCIQILAQPLVQTVCVICENEEDLAGVTNRLLIFVQRIKR